MGDHVMAINVPLVSAAPLHSYWEVIAMETIALSPLSEVTNDLLLLHHSTQCSGPAGFHFIVNLVNTKPSYRGRLATVLLCGTFARPHYVSSKVSNIKHLSHPLIL